MPSALGRSHPLAHGCSANSFIVNSRTLPPVADLAHLTTGGRAVELLHSKRGHAYSHAAGRSSLAVTAVSELRTSGRADVSMHLKLVDQAHQSIRRRGESRIPRSLYGYRLLPELRATQKQHQSGQSYASLCLGKDGLRSPRLRDVVRGPAACDLGPRDRLARVDHARL